MAVVGSSERGRRTSEWPTVLLLVAFFAVLGTVFAFQAHIPWPVELLLLTYLGGLWMALGHELLHGHPTRWRWLNSSIGSIPLSLWIPFFSYKWSHIRHHRCDLTDPVDDPESGYVSPAQWRRYGSVRRTMLVVVRTAAGRLTLGVPRGIVLFTVNEVRSLRREPRLLLAWAAHLALAVPLAWWLFAVVGVSPWTYVIGFVLGGSACTQLRSFVEHKAVAEGTRSAVVKAGPVMSLLYLNLNLHHTHHADPDLAWYRIPQRHRELGSDAIAAAGAGLYEGGYLQVLRMYFWKPFGEPVHPLTGTVD